MRRRDLYTFSGVPLKALNAAALPEEAAGLCARGRSLTSSNDQNLTRPIRFNLGQLYSQNLSEGRSFGSRILPLVKKPATASQQGGGGAAAASSVGVTIEISKEEEETKIRWNGAGPAACYRKDAPDQLGVPDAGIRFSFLLVEITATREHESSVLEDRDPKYDDMLKQMVGRIRSRPGGKAVMGEAIVRERYTRSLPKLRSSRAEPGASEQNTLPPGTLSIEHVRQIILLHQGKAEDHSGKMDVQDIAKRYGVDVEHVQQIIQFMSLPPEDGKKNNSNR
ncbi:hypothetical protein ZIOFF_034351 [Zingiber officinale]|uniref:Uncharacterized protein n=1 Tax=Zingiber officinale TaxID=94328 RepID=A0A8J5GRW7_ZINOF|nr:hypothetical protein ZIOFF_034351 [Zingiber officinale]